MDGERDPKVLIFLFNWLPKFLTSLEFGHLLEEMFEVVACYFPVDFKAPSQDPNVNNPTDFAHVTCNSCIFRQ